MTTYGPLLAIIPSVAVTYRFYGWRHACAVTLVAGASLALMHKWEGLWAAPCALAAYLLYRRGWRDGGLFLLLGFAMVQVFPLANMVEKLYPALAWLLILTYVLLLPLLWRLAVRSVIAASGPAQIETLTPTGAYDPSEISQVVPMAVPKDWVVRG